MENCYSEFSVNHFQEYICFANRLPITKNVKANPLTFPCVQIEGKFTIASLVIEDLSEHNKTTV